MNKIFRKNNKKNNSNNKIKIVLIITIFLTTIGYAAINTNLNIDGLISLEKKEIVDITFSNLKINNTNLNNLISNDGKSFTFNSNNLSISESSIEYEISNKSEKYDAKVNVTCVPSKTQATTIDYDNKTKNILAKSTISDTATATTIKLGTDNRLYALIKNQSKGTDTANNIDYNAISSSSNGQGVYETSDTDSGKTVYFYRGNIDNNNVIYGGYCWQILRTTETDGVKLFYNGVATNGKCSKPAGLGIGSYPFNSANNDNAYAGYMYGTANSTTYSDTHKNTNDSVIKQKIDEWYVNNISGKSYESYLEDTTWCNDRSIPTDKSNWSSSPSTYIQTGIKTNNTLYGFALRGGRYATITNPTLKCANTNDRLNVSNKTLTYPIATITADEMIYAGATGGKFNSNGTSPENPNYFLANSTGNVWTMTPTMYSGNQMKGSVLYQNGALSTMWTNVARNIGDIGIRPAVSLKNEIYVESGNGTFDSPYIVTDKNTVEEENTNFTCSLNIESISEATTEESVLGKEYCIGTECFYIIGYDGSNYTLLAKYNLYVGNIVSGGTISSNISPTDSNYGKQNPLALADKTEPRYANVAYDSSNTSNSYESSTVKPYVDEYVNYLNTNFDANATGRLVTTDDLVKLGCVIGGGTGGTHGCDYPEYAKYDWVIASSYWTQSPGTNAKSIYLVGGDGYFNAVSSITNNTNRGIRPVIIVPATNEKTSNVPEEWQDNGIFSEYYEQAYEKLQTMTLNEKIGQLMIVRHDSTTLTNAVPNYYVSGTTFYASDFTGKTKNQVISMTSNLQSASKIPLITAVDEEGGKVIRISSNTNLASEPFKSSQELYSSGGLDAIRIDTVNKSALLRELGLNMNFAPVVDIADSTSYIYPRTLGQSAQITGQYARTVIEASKNTGVSYSMKHFPGYGNNSDTHSSSSVDETSLEELNNKHLVPFVAGIDSGAEAVMISHNIISAIDKENPASLSKGVHDLLFNDLKFTGIAITDDLDMDAAKDVPNNYTKAILAGNNIILLSNYQSARAQILENIENGTITEDLINYRAFKVLAWKYYKKIL